MCLPKSIPAFTMPTLLMERAYDGFLARMDFEEGTGDISSEHFGLRLRFPCEPALDGREEAE